MPVDRKYSHLDMWTEQHMKAVIARLFKDFDPMQCGRVFPEVITFRSGAQSPESGDDIYVAKVINRKDENQVTPWVVVDGFTGSSAQGNGKYLRARDFESYPCYKQENGSLHIIRNSTEWSLGYQPGNGWGNTVWANKSAPQDQENEMGPPEGIWSVCNWTVAGEPDIRVKVKETHELEYIEGGFGKEWVYLDEQRKLLRSMATSLNPQVPYESTGIVDFLHEYFKVHGQPPPNVPGATYKTFFYEVWAEQKRVSQETVDMSAEGLNEDGMLEFTKKVHHYIFTHMGKEMKLQKLQYRPDVEKDVHQVKSV